MNNIRIVFMGTPEFATATLKAIRERNLDIAGVVTVPDKPAGRGRKSTQSAVKEYALDQGLKIMQPVSLKDPVFLEELSLLNATLFIVVAFRMLPAAVWKMPPLGTVNLHASLLPDFRGAAPINHAIIEGETVTGITTFLIDEQIDTGRILMREELPILPTDNAGDLHDKLMEKGAGLIIKTIDGIAEGTLKPVPQSSLLNTTTLRPAPKINPEFCIIDWSATTERVHNLIRGLSPYPCARTFFTGEAGRVLIKIFESVPEKESHSLKPGSILTDGRNYIRVACSDGFLSITSLQAEAKKRLNISEFLRGFRMDNFTSAGNPKA